MKDDRFWMRKALEEAGRALGEGEVPVGAVLIHGGEIVGSGHNRTEQTGLPFEHAEFAAMSDAIKKHGRWILPESVLYVTVEPCVMCVGAILLGRVPKVVFGTREPRTGACESVFAIPSDPAVDHGVAVIGGVEEDRCADLLRTFFRGKRAAEDGRRQE